MRTLAGFGKSTPFRGLPMAVSRPVCASTGTRSTFLAGVRRIVTRYRLLVLSCLALAPPAHGQQDSAKRTGTGRVPPSRADSASRKFLRVIQIYDADTQEPIVGADVKDRITGNSVRSSPTGHIGLMPDFVRATGAFIEIRKVGYNTVGPILLDPLADTTLLIPMSKVAVNLPAVVSTAPYSITRDPGDWSGFEQRCGVKHAACIREEELSTHPSAKLQDFLARADGIVPKCGVPAPQAVPAGRGARPRSSTVCVALMHATSGTGLCTPTFFVNGFEWSPLGGIAQQDLEVAFAPTDIKGIEVYDGQKRRPLRFGGAFGCGVIAIWTK